MHTAASRRSGPYRRHEPSIKAIWNIESMTLYTQGGRLQRWFRDCGGCLSGCISSGERATRPLYSALPANSNALSHRLIVLPQLFCELIFTGYCANI